MAQVKIYGHAEYLKGRQQLISGTVHRAAQETLDLPAEKRFHRFFGLAQADFIHPADRSGAYLILEIHLFQGRSASTLEAYIRALQAHLGQALALAPNDLKITLIETPAAHWGIRGQLGHELQFNYEVNK